MTLAAALIAMAQEPQAVIRVEVTAAATPVGGAKVTVNDRVVQTDAQGLARITVPFGEVRIAVAKDGYFPATASLTVDVAP